MDDWKGMYGMYTYDYKCKELKGTRSYLNISIKREGN